MPFMIALRIALLFGLAARLFIAVTRPGIRAADWCNGRAGAWNKRAEEILDENARRIP